MDFNNIASLLNGVTNDKNASIQGSPHSGGSSWIIWIIAIILICCCNGNGFGNFGNRGSCCEYECYCRRKRHKRKRCCDEDYCDNDSCCDSSFLLILILILCCFCKQQPACVPVREARSSSNIINVDSKEEE